MKGFPKYFNTKQDVLNVIAEYPTETKAFLQRCIDERIDWITTKKLEEGETGIIDATHRIQELKDDITKEVTERYQEKYKEDPNCKLFRLGFTVEEAYRLIV
jgi:DNA mismatch repair ATPase MutS